MIVLNDLNFVNHAVHNTDVTILDLEIVVSEIFNIGHSFKDIMSYNQLKELIPERVKRESYYNVRRYLLLKHGFKNIFNFYIKTDKKSTKNKEKADIMLNELLAGDPNHLTEKFKQRIDLELIMLKKSCDAEVEERLSDKNIVYSIDPMISFLDFKNKMERDEKLDKERHSQMIQGLEMIENNISELYSKLKIENDIDLEKLFSAVEKSLEKKFSTVSIVNKSVAKNIFREHEEYNEALQGEPLSVENKNEVFSRFKTLMMNKSKKTIFSKKENKRLQELADEKKMYEAEILRIEKNLKNIDDSLKAKEASVELSRLKWIEDFERFKTSLTSDISKKYKRIIEHKIIYRNHIDNIVIIREKINKYEVWLNNMLGTDYKVSNIKFFKLNNAYEITKKSKIRIINIFIKKKIDFLLKCDKYNRSLKRFKSKKYNTAIKGKDFSKFILKKENKKIKDLIEELMRKHEILLNKVLEGEEE